MWSPDKVLRGTFQHIRKEDWIFCVVQLILFITCFIRKFVSYTRVVLMLELIVLTRISKGKTLVETVILYLQVGMTLKFLEESSVFYIRILFHSTNNN